jgi:Rod binding domain-containing protein
MLSAPAVAATDPRLSAFTSQTAAQTTKPGLNSPARLRAQASEFESAFMSTMFQSMFTAIDGDGPMGSTAGVAPWRSFLTQEYAKSFVQKGGIGLADHVYRALIAQQERRVK